jgi:cell division septal protein FtsQ
VFSWRVAWTLLVVLLLAVAGYRAVSLVYHSSLLRVSRVRVNGNVRVSTGEVEALVRELKGANILTANLTDSRRRLLKSPWLADVALRRVLPSTIDVYVSERRPVGLYRRANQLYLIASDGTVMDEFGPRYAEFDLPIVDGLVPTPSAKAARASRSAASANGKVDPARAALAARVIDEIRGSRELASRVSQIDVSNAHDAVVLLDDDPALLHVGEERFRERLQSYVEIAETLRAQFPDIDYVDLRFGSRVFVKPRGRAEGTAMQLPSAGKTF